MDTNEINRLLEHYKFMQDDEIANIHANSENLTVEAKEALKLIIQMKKVDLATMRQEEAEEAFQRDENLKLKESKKQIRNNRLQMIFLFIFIPVAIFRFVSQPQVTWDHAVRALMEVIILGVILLLFLGISDGLKKLVKKK